MKCLTHKQIRSHLRECARRSSLRTGKKFHAMIVTAGLGKTRNSFLNNTLLQFYGACGDTVSARKLFDEIPVRGKDTVDWTTLMNSYSRNNESVNSMRLFIEMIRQRVRIDDVTMISVLGDCAKLELLGFGIQVHGFGVKLSLRDQNVKVSHALMDMYCKCGLLNEVKRVFDVIVEKNVVSWTVFLNSVMKFEGVERGKQVFDEMPERNAVTWTVMISGYVGGGFTRESFELLAEMVLSRCYDLNYVTVCSILSACSQSGDMVMGMWVHVYVLKMIMGLNLDIMVGTALVDMYSKCGKIDSALRVFKGMSMRNVVTWNAMLFGLAMHGRGKDAIDMFPEMRREVEPDDLTFTAILSACSHSGLVDQGWHYFKNLELYGLKPKTEHYACMVDLLGRAGHLEDAEALIRQMQVPPNEVILGSLLGSCSVHGKLEIAEHVLRVLIQTDPDNTEYHVLLSNMYVLIGMRDAADMLRRDLRLRGIRKVPGMSSIRVDGRVHRFSAGDTSHPESDHIYMKLDEMIRRLRSAGYVPNTSAQVFSATDDTNIENGSSFEDKEQALFSHSEKLAVCFGIMSTKPGSSLYIFKNLRICRDCHSAIKIVSKVYDREIIVRDRNRFHRFREGICSCSDYW